MYHHFWMRWINRNVSDLERGELPVPGGFPHPRDSGFDLERTAWPVGQLRDWVLSFTDGSRLHVHERADGSMSAHIDRFDPRHSAGHVLRHLLFETPVVPIGLVALAAVQLTKRV